MSERYSKLISRDSDGIFILCKQQAVDSTVCYVGDKRSIKRESWTDADARVGTRCGRTGKLFSQGR